MKLLVSAIFLFFSLGLCTSFAQEMQATTSDGRTVILKKDGTWEFVKQTLPPKSDKIKSYSKPEKSTSQIAVNGGKIHVWYDPAIWKQKKEAENPGRITFIHKDGDVYGMILSERVSMDISALKELAIGNARKAAPNIKVTLEENRIINDTQVLCLKMEGVTQGISFIYYGYYYSGKEGIIQCVTYTFPNLFTDYETDMSDFLNGFTIK